MRRSLLYRPSFRSISLGLARQAPSLLVLYLLLVLQLLHLPLEQRRPPTEFDDHDDDDDDDGDVCGRHRDVFRDDGDGDDDALTSEEPLLLSLHWHCSPQFGLDPSRQHFNRLQSTKCLAPV